jgi:hypothetical protein
LLRDSTYTFKTCKKFFKKSFTGYWPCMQSYSRSRPVAWHVFPVKCCVLLFVNISCEFVGLTSTYDKIHGTYDTERNTK